MYSLCALIGTESRKIIEPLLQSHEIKSFENRRTLEEYSLDHTISHLFVDSVEYFQESPLRVDSTIVILQDNKKNYKKFSHLIDAYINKNTSVDEIQEILKDIESKTIPIKLHTQLEQSFLLKNRPRSCKIVLRPEGKNVVLQDTAENISPDIFLTSISDDDKLDISEKWRNRKSDIGRNSTCHFLPFQADDLLSIKIKKTKTLSAIVSSEFQLEGHHRRIEFMKFLSSRLVNGKIEGMYTYDLYGRQNIFNLSNYRGEVKTKDLGLRDYYYSIAIENSSQKGYFTEKLIDCILMDCIPFYYGCPDVAQYIDPRCYIWIDITKPEIAYQRILRSILYDEYSKRKPYLLQTKKRIINMFLFPTIEKLLSGTFIPNIRTLVLNLDRRPDRWNTFEQKALDVCYERYERFSATDGKTLEWTDEIEKIFSAGLRNWVKNPYGGHNYMPGVVGVAVSHYRMWKVIAEGEDDIVIVLEDDAIFCKDFAKRWVNTYNLLKEDDKWECVFLGSIDCAHNEEVFISENHQKLGIRLFDPRKFRTHGSGAYGYMMRKSAASKYIQLAQQTGIRHPVDWFMIEHFDKIVTYRIYPELIDHVVASKGGNTDIQVNPHFFRE